MADVSLADLIARARLESGLRNNAYYDSDQIIRYLDAGGSELSDIFTQANQYYVIKTFDFTCPSEKNSASTFALSNPVIGPVSRPTARNARMR